MRLPRLPYRVIAQRVYLLAVLAALGNVLYLLFR
jgi:hypothetical protein